MAELIDISNEKFWDILFDEACVEGQQAERIEAVLKTISTTEAELEDAAIAAVRAKAIDEFAERAIKIVYEANNRRRNPQPRDMVADIHYKLRDLAEQLKEE